MTSIITARKRSYVFTGVCLSTGGVSICSQGGLLHCLLGYTPRPEADPPGRHPPVQCMLGCGQQAGGTHPTRMHSCFAIVGPFTTRYIYNSRQPIECNREVVRVIYHKSYTRFADYKKVS